MAVKGCDKICNKTLNRTFKPQRAMDPLEAIPLELQQLIFSKIPFKYFYVSLVCRRWNKLFWQTRTSIVLHKDTEFHYAAKLKNEDEFNALLTKLRPELIERVAQQNDSLLISNLDKFKNLTSFAEYQGEYYYDNGYEPRVQIYSTLKNLPKLKHLDLQFTKYSSLRLSPTELLEIISGCTSLETLRLQVNTIAGAHNNPYCYLTNLMRLQHLHWSLGSKGMETLAKCGMQLTRIELNTNDSSTNCLTSFTNLKSLILTGSSAMFAAEVIPTSTTLEDLEIHVINPLSEFYEDLLKLTALTNLTRFAIHALDWEGPRDVSPFHWITALPSIQNLTLSVSCVLPDNLSQCTGLTQLKATVSSVDELSVPLQLTNLASLTIDGRDIFDIEQALTHLIGFTRLRRLEISTQGTENELVEFPLWHQLTSLAHLKLNNLGDVMEEQILALVEAMPNLESLELWGYRVDELTISAIPNTRIKFISTLSEADRFWFRQYTKHIQDTIYWRFYDTT